MTGVGFHDCAFCNGTGIDYAELDERCVFCSGSGQIRDDDEPFDEEDWE